MVAARERKEGRLGLEGLWWGLKRTRGKGGGEEHGGGGRHGTHAMCVFFSLYGEENDRSKWAGLKVRLGPLRWLTFFFLFLLSFLSLELDPLS